VIGYGNPLRHDDRVGQDVAHLLRALRDCYLDPELEGAQIYAMHQLLPEMVAELEGAHLAVFVDAEQCPPSMSTVSMRWLTPSADLAPSPRPPRGSCWEDLTPEWLLGLALLLYGAVPRQHLSSWASLTSAWVRGCHRSPARPCLKLQKLYGSSCRGSRP
jgi:hypothetical protein